MVNTQLQSVENKNSTAHILQKWINILPRSEKIVLLLENLIQKRGLLKDEIIWQMKYLDINIRFIIDVGKLKESQSHFK